MMLSKNKQDLILVFAVVTALIVAVFAYSLPLPAQREDILYLLSSVSQGLAAILALVFAITIFGAQMMRKFTAMDKMIDKWTIFLMLLFSIGIIFPLMQLRTDEGLLNLNSIDTAKLSLSFDLGIVTFCVLAIIPFLMRVNSIMKYEGGIPKLSEEASEAVDSLQEVTASYKIRELAELGKCAVDDLKEKEAIKIITSMKELGLRVAEKRWDRATLIAMEGLKEIGETGITKKLDRDVLDKLDIKYSRGEGVWTNGSVVREAIDAMSEIGVEAAHKELIDPTAYSIKNLKLFGLSAIKNNLSDFTVYASSLGLFKVGEKVVHNILGFGMMPEPLWVEEPIQVDLIENLLEIANSAYEKDREIFTNTTNKSMIDLWVLCAVLGFYVEGDYDKKMVMRIKKLDFRIIKDLFRNDEIRRGVEEELSCGAYPYQVEKRFEELYDETIIKDS